MTITRSELDALLTRFAPVPCESAPNLFFASDDEEDTALNKWLATHYAKKLCEDCPIRKQCLEYALSERVPFGVWGGKSARQRAKMRL